VATGSHAWSSPVLQISENSCSGAIWRNLSFTWDKPEQAIKICGDDMNLNDKLELTKAVANEYHTIVLAEGISDMLALNTLAQRLGINLDAMGTAIVTMGGATNIGHFMDLLIPYRQAVNIAGLYDVGEEHHFQRALERAGFGSDLTRSDLETLGFYVCDVDLEDELIRAVGVDGVIEVADEQGELRSFRTLQTQPAWRGRKAEDQFRRWIGAGSTRKTRYAALLVNALNLSCVPAPLDSLLSHISHKG
jgi:hypothetical protein